MREIVFDTETTGLERLEDRVIEIGGVELINKFPTGRTFHKFINPQGRQVHAEALAVHGISNEQLLDKPTFAEILDEFLEFFDGAKLVAHNAMFDLGFMNAELARLGKPEIAAERIVDTLALARRKHPMGPNSLDALCKRYGIDNSHRTLHGALLDSQILAEVYIELIGGKQTALGLSQDGGANRDNAADGSAAIVLAVRPAPLAPRISETERAAHAALIEGMGDKAIWKKYLA
ncbi:MULTISPECIES: DNA polymerase III subunit epsilon [Brucella/Ochrobactrum group]|uniref:DNA polymerase III subunit epsilon n=2 Tax=Ochrobactrum TaxID=528 RepID=A0A2P9HRT0_9HYPH|nr:MULTISPECIES: DNA polymerase III subunit epsilon [Brucella]MCI0998549.1 DNA polymerase III subunit epsilon [Ochrobactrum sp. C6C9]RRD27625.1 DNA polymerase III subunit epsilon [Brucellaceae bacterium VT-16-1752]WHT41529.1 DNA polymerase III subunit epsilon [Ochrobactrum sp. SSR]MDX4074963.1 DNA polymerase III subunit epsilon [Brucella sp. NBRC 113783]NNU59252.1 DNA polymerase III subunit epsilon [[Ochrobactrum] soli]